MKATFKSRYLFSTVEPCLLLPVVLFYEKYYETVKKLRDSKSQKAKKLLPKFLFKKQYTLGKWLSTNFV